MSNRLQLPQPHRRQFVIGSSPFLPNDNWLCRQLNSSRWLSYCPDLRINWARDTNGIEWSLLGLAVQTESNLEPIAQIARLSTAEVIKNYSSWAGRWLLIGNEEIHLDANGLLGCLYGRDSQGNIWVSSSPALLSQIVETSIRDSRTLEYAKRICWYTPPYSGFKGIKRLLASQILNFTSGEIIPRPLMPDIERDSNYEQTMTSVKDALVTALQNLGKQQQPLWLGLTAGYDSRLMLAIAKEAQINFTSFTRVAGRMSIADRILPPKLAQECGIPHIFLRHKPPQEQAARKRLVQQHTAGNVSDGDAEPYIMGVRDSLTGISFGGHGWAVASGFYTLRQLPPTFDSPRKGAEQIASLFNEPTNSSAVEGMTEWLTWVQQHPQKNLDWRDRFFLEQRQAGWLSSKEQVYDLTDLMRFPILNAARTYSLLLSIPEAKRLGSLVQVALIEQLVPELLQYPFNPPDSYFDYFNRGLKMIAKMQSNWKYLYWRVKNRFVSS